ncbi:hypothetical protein AB0F81_07695 [Actinoplanes sp. NPDC024001]|uniref:hypothetical protein n=1 Tax=Actinoplanes sp. NPDC024001 TaxID=3154598 RepID=UPI0033CA2AF6
MNKAMRLLALAGASLAAGAMIGSGPVQAAPAAAPSTGSSTGNHVQSWADDYDYVVGYYRWQRACRNAGWTGVKFGAWDKFKCSPVRIGWHRWAWELEVRQQYWNWDDWDGFWPGHWPNKPDFMGGPFDIGKPYKHKGFPWKHYKGNKFDDWKDSPNGPGEPWKVPQGPGGIKDGGDPWKGPQGPGDIKGQPWKDDHKGPDDIKGHPWQNQGDDKGMPWKTGPNT